MKKNNKVLVLGGATIDITFAVGEGKMVSNPFDPIRQKLIGFENGAKITSEETNFGFGGGAANVAVALSRLGISASVAVRVGDDDNGRQVVNNLKKNKVNTDFVQVGKKEKTGISFIIAPSATDDHIAFLERGANNNFLLNKSFEKLNFDWIYLASVSEKNWQVTSDKIIDYLKPQNSFAWNLGSAQIRAGLKNLKKYLAKTDILFLNKDEAIELVMTEEKNGGMSPKWLNEVKNLFGVLGKYCPKMIVITDGGNGAWAWEKENLYHIEAFDQEKIIRDTTGAGDSFCASFLAGNIIYNDIDKALKLGAINSAHNVSGIGAQNPLLTRSEAEKLMN
ncbi:hypothetical protein A2316_03550 [Candidatus Falkowbacteria bacterium RIFOXYB2_FULL_38_15]|uniref:Carbohydrate kinase PfkB domain-containing protein n=1 Tax=Candidatus Falkowbacteria bacterium RIFOXYA2_FULL_38_12 TaxID=1797993 RepID=A0A1F5S1D6_9BACT|nr:MAG: hypothetical protein A2257_03780 [Candidatus Falkowbacteria bacterium RIFOXYA2_FULL_38_12]OGF33555.1 MAG: hypothetical protein A2316_03550 [Candidatus Falkowbacteria bacterium RIFOXYB2_FULL_38_15]OGF44161.1 MAG: hypothetical protein A2555_02115 [Candidatus Falkowbacteria bacterium RIFOXYD2_FULL_39_16]